MTIRQTGNVESIQFKICRSTQPAFISFGDPFLVGCQGLGVASPTGRHVRVAMNQEKRSRSKNGKMPSIGDTPSLFDASSTNLRTPWWFRSYLLALRAMPMSTSRNSTGVALAVFFDMRGRVSPGWRTPPTIAE